MTVDLDVLRNRVGINPVQHERALAALASGSVAWVVVSGKMCAGKDTVAPALADAMPTTPTMLRYGDLMRAELDPALDVLRERVAGGINLDITVVELSELMDLPRHHTRELVDLLAPELKAARGALTAYSRTEGIRRVLINLGDDWRCLEDEDYWARKAARAALDEIAQGRSVIQTGGRFLPDVQIPAAAGAMVLRLDVSRETQIARLRDRDGLEPSAETIAALDDKSETALDDYTGFTAHVDNNGELDECIEASRAAVTRQLTTAQAA